MKTSLKSILAERGIRAERGFTLIELLVVIVIIGILATGSIAVFTGTQAKARNAVRKGDLKTMQNSVELFKANSGGISAPDDTDAGDDTYTAFRAQLVSSYMQELPVEPGENNYAYIQDETDTELYRIYGYDEETNAEIGIVFGTGADVGVADCTDGTSADGTCDGTAGRTWSCDGVMGCGD